MQANFALLTTPQERKIHAILGSCLALTRIPGAPKTQLQAKQKTAKNLKAKLVEDKKTAIAACKAKSIAKKKERLISFAKAKAAKAGSKVANSALDWQRLPKAPLSILIQGAALLLLC